MFPVGFEVLPESGQSGSCGPEVPNFPDCGPSGVALYGRNGRGENLLWGHLPRSGKSGFWGARGDARSGDTLPGTHAISAGLPPVKNPLYPLQPGCLMFPEPKQALRVLRVCTRFADCGAFNGSRWHPYPGPRIRRSWAPRSRSFSELQTAGV